MCKERTEISRLWASQLLLPYLPSSLLSPPMAGQTQRQHSWWSLSSHSQWSPPGHSQCQAQQHVSGAWCPNHPEDLGRRSPAILRPFTTVLCQMQQAGTFLMTEYLLGLRSCKLGSKHIFRSHRSQGRKKRNSGIFFTVNTPRR